VVIESMDVVLGTVGKRLSIVAQNFREFVLNEASQILQLPAA